MLEQKGRKLTRWGFNTRLAVSPNAGGRRGSLGKAGWPNVCNLLGWVYDKTRTCSELIKGAFFWQSPSHTGHISLMVLLCVCVWGGGVVHYRPIGANAVIGW